MFTFRLAALAPFLFLLAACNTDYIDRDELIAKELSAKLRAQNMQIIKGLISGKQHSTDGLVSDSLRRHESYKTGFKELSAVLGPMAAKHPPVVKRQFYVNFPMKNQAVNISSGEGGEHDYFIRYKSPTRRSYVLLSYIEDSIQTIAFLTIWNSFDGKWKLYSAYAGPIRILGMDAVDWYYKAKQQYDDFAYADAACSISMCMLALKPGGDYLQYKTEADMSSLVDQIKIEAGRFFHFPIDVGVVSTWPIIVGLKGEVYGHNLVPEIRYTTKIPLSDTARLSRECDSLNAHIGDIFKDIDHNNKVICYRAFPDVPADSVEYHPSYIFIKKSAAPWQY